MRAHAWFLATLALIAGFIVFVFSLVVLKPSQEGSNGEAAKRELTPLERPMVAFGDPVKGSRDAKVTIVTFGDFGCAPCGTLAATLSEAITRRPQDVRVVWKDLPNPSLHPGATDAAMAARCAAEQGAFWEYHDVLFGTRSTLSVAALGEVATAVGLDRGAFDDCLSTGRTRPIVERSVEEAIRLRVDATPTIFIDDRRLTGAIGAEALNAAIDDAIARAASPSP